MNFSDNLSVFSCMLMSFKGLHCVNIQKKADDFGVKASDN